MTVKGHWCGAVQMKSKGTTETISLLYTLNAAKQWKKRVIVHWTLWPFRSGSWEVIDRALDISDSDTTDASVEYWANPARTGCLAADYLFRNDPPMSELPSVSNRSVDTRTEKQDVADKAIDTIPSLTMWRRNIHSTLTLAARTQRAQRRWELPGVVPAFTWMQKKVSQVHFFCVGLKRYFQTDPSQEKICNKCGIDPDTRTMRARGFSPTIQRVCHSWSANHVWILFLFQLMTTRSSSVGVSANSHWGDNEVSMNDGRQ